MIKLQNYIISKNLPLTNELLSLYINAFWEDIFNEIKENKHLLLMCKVEFTNSEMGYRTLGHLRKVNFNDKELFIEYLLARLTILNDSYVTLPISKITFSYIIRDGLCNDQSRALLKDLSNKLITFHNFNNMNLPVSMNPADYGTVEIENYVQLESELVHRFIVSRGTRTYRFDVSSDNKVNNVTILGAMNLTWMDTLVGENLIKREIKKSTVYFLDGEVVLKKQILNAKPFKLVKTDNKIVNDFYTLDLETINQNGKLIPYLICAYDGANFITSYGENQTNLFKNFFDQLIATIKPKTTTIIYAHNLSGFDGNFLFKHLIKFGTVDPLLHNNKLISIKLKVSGSNKILIFKDSLLLLPLSLRQLCKAFNVVTSKGYFPFLLFDIFYTGVIPRFELWTGLNLQEYGLIKETFKNKMWSFQEQAIKYCKLDCSSLHEILVKFNELIYNEFQINVHTSLILTLPSLAMRIYKAHFMPANSIYQILGKPESFIRESYTGGAVDVYIPHNRISAFISNIKSTFKKLYYYDVNSLYPSVMANMEMPIGLPIAFTGDIRQIESEAFGYFYCKITSPTFIEHPLLQRRVKTSDGIRTIAGLGTWEGWVFSAEMDNAVKFGYTFEILKGYQFEKANIFKDYVTKLYNLRLKYPKGNAMNLIAKLLMNSLYGKFGMKLETTQISSYNVSTEETLNEFKDMIKLFGETITDYIKIDNTFFIVRNTKLSLKYDEELDKYHGQDVNIAIASAITSYSRIKMSYFKNNPNFNLYYSDTDSAITDKALPIEMVGNGLGQVKLEYTINRAVFLAPKVYGFLTDSEEVIKVKGLSKEVLNDFHVKDLEDLLIKDSSKIFTQEKWNKKLIQGEININEVAYTLKTTSNKRSPVYNNNIFES